MNDNVPLIASYESNVTCAYDVSCMKIARLQCPCDGCKVALCYAHLSDIDKEAQRTGQKMLVPTLTTFCAQSNLLSKYE